MFYILSDMKVTMTHVNEKLHSSFKALAKSGRKHKYNMSDLLELGILLVLAESGEIDSFDSAIRLGASQMPARLLERIIAGESW